MPSFPVRTGVDGVPLTSHPFITRERFFNDFFTVGLGSLFLSVTVNTQVATPALYSSVSSTTAFTIYVPAFDGTVLV